MNISYYTIDDLRRLSKHPRQKGRGMEQFPTLEEALTHYRTLPAAGIRALGLTDGVHVLELVKCLPLLPDDRTGEDVLASDYRQFPLGGHGPTSRRRPKPPKPVSFPWPCAIASKAMWSSRSQPRRGSPRSSRGIFCG